MSEIAKCPICGKEPEVWCRDEEIRIRIVCCKHAAYSTLGWNQYAAAMEFAKAVVWAAECEDQKDYMEDTISNRDAWRSIVNSTWKRTTRLVRHRIASWRCSNERKEI